MLRGVPSRRCSACEGEADAYVGNLAVVGLAVEYRNGVDWSNLLRWGVPVLMVLLTALLVHGVGHWRLRREVAGRRQLEQRLAG